MIDTALTYLSHHLQEAMEVRLGAAADTVTLGAIPDGAATEGTKLYLMLVGLREDTTTRSKPIRADAEAAVATRPATKPLPLECTLLLAATGSPYSSALQLLSEALIVLRGLSVIDPEALPAATLPGGRLTLELISLDSQEQNHLWATVGGKYAPSAVYRLRLVTLTDSVSGEEDVPLIKQTDLYTPRGPTT